MVIQLHPMVQFKTRIDKQNSDPEQRKQLTQDRCIPEKQSKLWCVYYNPAKEKP